MYLLMAVANCYKVKLQADKTFNVFINNFEFWWNFKEKYKMYLITSIY